MVISEVQKRLCTRPISTISIFQSARESIKERESVAGNYKHIMRKSLLLFLLAVLGFSRATWSAECTEVCAPATFSGIAIPNCTEPTCEIVCTTGIVDNVCDDIEETVASCKTRCDITACFNTTPPCEIQCKDEVDCDDVNNCTMVCEELACNWILAPGAEGPDRECNITCEAVDCASSAATPRFSLF